MQPLSMADGGTTAAPRPGAHGAAVEVLPLRAKVAAAPWRRRLAASRVLDRAYRSSVALVGGVIVVVGLVTVPLPGPGWLTVLAGLLVLSSEFASAERMLVFTERHLQRWAHWLGRQPVWVGLALATASAVLAYAVLVLTLRVVGVPGWMPDWAPFVG